MQRKFGSFVSYTTATILDTVLGTSTFSSSVHTNLSASLCTRHFSVSKCERVCPAGYCHNDPHFLVKHALPMLIFVGIILATMCRDQQAQTMGSLLHLWNSQRHPPAPLPPLHSLR